MKLGSLNNRILHIVIWYLILIGSLTFVVPELNNLPSGVHNWAQSDRLSVAFKFQDHANIFYARTHNISTPDGQCGVEFPLFQFVSAQLSRIIHKAWLPAIYRTINFGFLLFGLWFYAGSFRNNLIGAIWAILAASAPVLLFYANGFLPDVGALSIIIISLGFYRRASQNQSLKYYLYAIALGYLASLVKTTAGIYALALSGAVFLQFIRKANYNRAGLVVLTSVVSLVLVIGYDYVFFHKVNKDLFSPIFMSSGQPLTTWADWREFFKSTRYWLGQSVSLLQLGIILILSIYALLSRAKNSLNRDALIWIYIIGLLGFIGVMGKQFIHHDYYYITSLYPLIFMLVSENGLERLLQNRVIKYAVIVLTLGSFGLGLNLASKRFSHHYSWKNKGVAIDIAWMQGGGQTLNSIGIDPDATIFICYTAAPNTGLLHFNRNGKTFNHEEMTRNPKVANVYYWKDRLKPDYLIVPQVHIVNLKDDQPPLWEDMYLFAKRDNYSIYKLNY